MRIVSASTAVICVVLVLAVLFGLKHFVRHLSTGCCGGGDAPSRRAVRDRNRKHYPYRATLSIEGMTCRNCAIHVENALNGLDGVWARVDLGKRTATVLMKSELGDGRLKSSVAAAGYLVRAIRRPGPAAGRPSGP